jgi:H+-translocating NAD(P) transhydrogenase subunit beta
MISPFIQNIVYLVSAFLFILGLKQLGSPATARKGNMISSVGMLLAIVVTLLGEGILSYQGIAIGMAIGTVVGIAAARMIAMTAMPEMVALLNGFGGSSSLLLGVAAYLATPVIGTMESVSIVLSLVIGGITFTGSLIAWAKLSEKISGKPVQFFGQNIINSALLLATVVLGILFVLNPAMSADYMYMIIGLSLVLGIMSVVSIGGGDMPVVISLLNSYSGLAACAAGFVIQNMLLIVAGALVGASGLILTNIMCKAMNRSLKNVLFSGFGSGGGSVAKGSEEQGEVNPITAQDAYYILESAQSVLVVPGYGMAVAQAQHVVKELGHQLEANGAEVKFAIHPVAGRMPGHMNVLLAEADVPYDQLSEMDDVNPIMDSVDVCIVIGANDVVNPDALKNETSPIYGMPIIEVERAKTVFVLKRSMNTGFAGIQNPLFFKDNTRMLFGDAKETVSTLVSEFKD